MRKLSYYLKRTIQLGPTLVLKKCKKKYGDLLTSRFCRQLDTERSTYSLDLKSKPQLASLFLATPTSLPDKKNLEELGAKFLSHQFNLLGSGWVDLNRKIDRVSLSDLHLNLPNLREAERIWSFLTKDYKPIDWQLDFRSGERWSETTWFKDIRYGDRVGVDIKTPWELARMQHLFCFAWLSQYDPQKKWLQEFQNQTLDFIATNPPRYGVNWACTMDVSIRAANWILAYSMFSSLGVEFVFNFKDVLARSIYEHGKHIYENLEDAGDFRGNHYLSNICALIFIGGSLIADSETKRWLQFASEELYKETLLQFNPDGSNFEASTSYHRLSAEMVFYSSAVLLGMRQELPSYFVERLKKIILFSVGIRKSDGGFPQIGDNDSGRFFKLLPFADAKSHGSIFSAAEALFGISLPGSDPLETAIFRSLADQQKLSSKYLPASTQALFSFRDFGIYILKNKNFELFIRCGDIGQKGHGGHAHNDQLSFELSVGGEDFILDPGTYLYTSEPSERNRFRSSRFHNGVSIDGFEQNPFDKSVRGLFKMANRARAQAIKVDELYFEGIHQGYPFHYHRSFQVESEKLIIREKTNVKTSKEIRICFDPNVQLLSSSAQTFEIQNNRVRLLFSAEAGKWSLDQDDYSPAYGIKLKTLWATLSFQEPDLEWYIKVQS